MTFAAPPPPRYKPKGAHFDGTNDYMTSGAGMSGAADNKQLLLAFAMRKTGSDGVGERIITNSTVVGNAANISMRVTKGTSQQLAFVALNAAGTLILNVSSPNSLFAVANGWRHVMFSCDLSDTAKRFLYVDDSAQTLTIATYTNDTIDHTLADWSVGANVDGTTKVDMDLADLIFHNTYLDLSVTANRRKLINGAGRLRGPSALGFRPLICLSGSVANWHKNKGTGGGFTLTGALTAASANPPAP